MCGIVGLHLRDPGLEPRLGELLTTMLGEMTDRGPDSAGVAVYGNRDWTPAGSATVTVLADGVGVDALTQRVGAELGRPVDGQELGATTLLSAVTDVDSLAAAVRTAAPEVVLVGMGRELAVLKGTGLPLDLAAGFGLAGASGWQGVGHTRMATESAVTPAGSHPFSVGPDQCIVHNGSFSNHASVRRQLARRDIRCDTLNDTEVAARFVAAQIAQGAGIDQALEEMAGVLDGFYTLLVSTADDFAVVRDPIACKPAVIAETDQYVAMASEYRAMAHLPGIESARLYEPEPGRIYHWHR
ncbi:glutamine amidotransferase [Dietzia alimentaria]|jgi:glutamate synthase domain-containing protein 1|uniref:glutamine amidotransferase n=1 Tax=Dietzia TaxID=37914 RepID=UPI0008488AC9|nr:MULTISPECIES: glutamine amidotransferase [Dietzia]ODQ86025.1 glutamine amidotransferase [Dietzia alimentaria]MBB1017353.1 glutamine amidotransferase [Dietzia sp. DQ11-71]MCZ4541697.1 glutamine amidotransferase [Dietzia maris]MCZ4657536.1 glutamine amidotransferase [Dietzia kunjamensis]MDV3356898.1 glutamine amidotransferase [Dietzia sp. IN118]